MNQEEINEIDNLTFDLNVNLNILNSAVMGGYDDLEVSDLIKFVNETAKISKKIRELFYNTF